MRKGNTYAATKKLIDRILTKPDVKCTEISVADLELPFCISCHVCINKGEEYCPHYDVVGKVWSALMECDGVIFSGTTYVRALNAAMKNLIDHLAYGYHRPALFGKKGMVVTTSAGTGEKGVAKYLKTVLGQWGINGAIIVTRNLKEQMLQSPDNETAMLNAAADRFYGLIASGRQIPPSLKTIATHNAFRAMLTSEFVESERDAQYWKQDGFYNRVYPAKARALRYMVGALTYGAANLAIKILGRKYVKLQKEGK